MQVGRVSFSDGFQFGIEMKLDRIGRFVILFIVMFV